MRAAGIFAEAARQATGLIRPEESWPFGSCDFFERLVGFGVTLWSETVKTVFRRGYQPIVSEFVMTVIESSSAHTQMDAYFVAYPRQFEAESIACRIVGQDFLRLVVIRFGCSVFAF